MRRVPRRRGGRQVLWLPFGLHGDEDTSGHVDNVCCFLRPGVLLLHWCDQDEDGEQHRRSQAALDYLETQVDGLPVVERVQRPNESWAFQYL